MGVPVVAGIEAGVSEEAMELDDLIARIKGKAHELHANGQPLEHAYSQAVSAVFMEAAEQRVTPFQERILETLRVLSPRPDSPPVKTSRLLIEISTLDDRWTVWYHLSALERAGLVYRPGGPSSKSGWKAREAGRFI